MRWIAEIGAEETKRLGKVSEIQRQVQPVGADVA